MLSFFKTIASRAIRFKVKFPHFNLNKFAMASEGSEGLKNKSNLKMEHEPVKKMKLESVDQSVETKVRTSSDLKMDHVPIKKLKLGNDDQPVKAEQVGTGDLKINTKPMKNVKVESDEATKTRTVATMCGAWRPEEEYGGIIFVFKKRDGGLSPDPTNEADYPENIQDFWEATFPGSDDEQVCRF